MKNNDKIMFDKREELAEEHPFLRTELGQYAFQLGFDAAVANVLERACNWLKKHADGYTWYNEMEGESGMIDDFIDDFKKAMEE